MLRFLGIFLASLSTAHANTKAAHSHYYLRNGEETFSVYVVRPIEPTLELEKNIESTTDLLKIAHDTALSNYQERGYFETPSPAILEDLGHLVGGKNPVVMITKKDYPSEVYQLVSVMQDAPGIPLSFETRFSKQNFWVERPVVRVSKEPEFRFLKEGPTSVVIKPTEIFPVLELLQRQGRFWALGAYCEIKTLVRTRKSPQDFNVIILQLLVAHELLRWSNTPVRPGLLKPIPSDEAIAEWEWGRRHKGEREAVYYLEPYIAPTLRTTGVLIEAPTEALRELYRSVFLFLDLATLEDPDVVGGKAHILYNDVRRLEEAVWEKLKHRESVLAKRQCIDALSDTAVLELAPGSVELFPPVTTLARKVIERLRPHKDKLLDNYQYASKYDPPSNVVFIQTRDVVDVAPNEWVEIERKIEAHRRRQQ